MASGIHGIHGGASVTSLLPLSRHNSVTLNHSYDPLAVSRTKAGNVVFSSSSVHLNGQGGGKRTTFPSKRISLFQGRPSRRFGEKIENDVTVFGATSSDFSSPVAESITTKISVVPLLAGADTCRIVSSSSKEKEEREDNSGSDLKTYLEAKKETLENVESSRPSKLGRWFSNLAQHMASLNLSRRVEQLWPSLLPSGALLGLGGALGNFNLEGPGSVLEAVGVLALIVTVHECGHFLAARVQNIHVTKFSIGFGPILTKYQGKTVEYTLRAIPLGGFVAFPDDDPESEFSPDDPDLLKNRPILDRAFVISAGVLANAIFAYTVLFTQVNSVGVLEQTFGPGVLVADVVENSAAYRGGLQKKDIVLGVDGSPLLSDQSSVIQLVEAIKASVGQTVHFDLLRGNENITVDIIPDKTSDGNGRIGVQLAPNAASNRVKAADLKEATELASEEFVRLLDTVVDGLKQIVFNFSQTADKVSGPVAIVAVGAEVARSDAAGLFQFAALVNLNLAVVNILPLPALDGGYLMLLLVEALRGGRKLPSGVEQGIMSSGLLLLLGVGVALMVRDTLNLGFLEGFL